MKNFPGSTALLSCEKKLRSRARKQQKDGQSTTKFSITERKLAYRYCFRVSDEESYSARKQMWKIASGGFIVFFLRIVLERPYNK